MRLAVHGFRITDAKRTDAAFDLYGFQHSVEWKWEEPYIKPEACAGVEDAIHLELKLLTRYQCEPTAILVLCHLCQPQRARLRQARRRCVRCPE